MVLITMSEPENTAFKLLSSNTFAWIISRLGISFKSLLASMFLVSTQILSHKGDSLADNCDPMNPVPYVYPPFFGNPEEKAKVLQLIAIFILWTIKTTY